MKKSIFKNYSYPRKINDEYIDSKPAGESLYKALSYHCERRHAIFFALKEEKDSPSKQLVVLSEDKVEDLSQFINYNVNNEEVAIKPNLLGNSEPI